MILVIVLIVAAGAFKALSMMVTHKAETIVGADKSGGGGGGAAGSASAKPANAREEFDPEHTHTSTGVQQAADSGSGLHGQLPRILLILVGVLGAGAMVVAMFRAKRGASN